VAVAVILPLPLPSAGGTGGKPRCGRPAAASPKPWQEFCGLPVSAPECRGFWRWELWGGNGILADSCNGEAQHGRKAAEPASSRAVTRELVLTAVETRRNAVWARAES
jgi:hypothetical protein